METLPDYEKYQRDKRSVWIFKLKEDYTQPSDFTGHTFEAKWLRIGLDGRITILEDYAWNGCSPKFSLLDLLVLGTPDGIIDIKSCRPKTYFATLVHDALYQYYPWLPISRKAIDELFLAMMKEKKFKLARLYYVAVRLFGGFGMKKHPSLSSAAIAHAE